MIREDGRFLYTLPSVVDDIDFAVTHVIRGEDHVTNTTVQIEIFEALGAPVPLFAQVRLLVGAGGEALSMRRGSLSLKSLREEEGIEPRALACYLAKTGTSDLFFFNDTATTEIYTLSLHDALPIFNSVPSISNSLPLTSCARTMARRLRSTPKKIPGKERQPSSPSCLPSWAITSGLIMAIR